jgi:octaprenyl-diphosphate synthase
MQVQTDSLSPIDRLASCLEDNMNRVNAVILDRMQSDIPMIPELAGYLIAAGGKRIRPLLTVACAALCNDTSDNPKKLAAAVEFIHTATLLHDDVIDESDQRRGKPTANSVFGNQEAILVGDFLFARAFELMVETGSIDALNSLARASAIITEGEILQLSLIGNTDITQDQYFKIIEAKTAALFATACEVSPLLNHQAPETFKTYGRCLGIAFQIVDDIMDYTSPKMGKNKGDDFMEGKITLPVILAIQSADQNDKPKIKSMMKNPNTQDLDEFINLLEKYNAFDKATDIAQDYSNNASNAIKDLNTNCEIGMNLINLPHSILNRLS